jgi:hypothetical protein
MPCPARRLACEALEAREVPATLMSYDDRIDGAAVDSAGNMYAYYVRVVGPADLDPGPGTRYVAGADPAGDGFPDVGRYFVKYAPDRSVVWVKSAAEMPAGVRATKVAVVPDGQGGEALLTFGAAISKLDLDGNLLWTRPTLSAQARFVDADGSIYTTGGFNLSADLDPTTNWVDGRDLLTNPNGQGMYVARWDAAGTLLWSRTISATANVGDPQGSNVWVGDVTAADGVVFVGGMFGGTLSLGGLINSKIDSASTRPDGFIAAYGADGTYQSVAQLIDAGVGHLSAAGGAVYVGASFQRTADLDPGPQQKLLTPGNIDGENLAVARLGYGGPAAGWSLSWAEKFVSSSGQSLASGLQVVGTNLFVSGEFGGTTDFDPGTGTNNRTAGGGEDAFAMRLDAATGGLGWVTQIGSIRRVPVGPLAESVSLVPMADGGLFLSGLLGQSRIDVRDSAGTVTGALEGGLDQDVFLGRVDAAGRYQWGFVVGTPGRMQDNSEAGYAETGSGWKASNLGFLANSRTHAKGTGANRATWTFTGLANGVYRVAATYPTNKQYASNVPFRLNGVPVIPVSQQVPPNDVAFWGEGSLNDLGTAVVTNGTLTVELSDAANGTVVADGVKCWLESFPLQAAGGAVTGSAASPLTETQLDLIVAEAVRRWNASGLTAAERTLLRSVQVQIADLDGATLGRSVANTILIDRDAAGYGWFVDPTPRSDSEFQRKGDQGEQEHMDLLTAVTHELGHMLGKGHEPTGLMAETLAPGIRESIVPGVRIGLRGHPAERPGWFLSSGRR